MSYSLVSGSSTHFLQLCSVDVILSIKLWPARNESTLAEKSASFQQYVEDSIAAFSADRVVDAEVALATGYLGAASTYVQTPAESSALLSEGDNLNSLRDAASNLKTIASSFDVTLSPALASGLAHITRLCATYVTIAMFCVLVITRGNI